MDALQTQQVVDAITNLADALELEMALMDNSSAAPGTHMVLLSKEGWCLNVQGGKLNVRAFEHRPLGLTIRGSVSKDANTVEALTLHNGRPDKVNMDISLEEHPEEYVDIVRDKLVPAVRDAATALLANWARENERKQAVDAVRSRLGMTGPTKKDAYGETSVEIRVNGYQAKFDDVRVTLKLENLKPETAEKLLEQVKQLDT